MYRIIILPLISMIFLLNIQPANGASWFWQEKPLLTLNGQQYTPEDFKTWWANWKDPNTPFPEDLSPFIKWHLRVQEAERMQLFQEPEYQRKIEIFLKVRSMMLLKSEEINGRMDVSHDRLWKRYTTEFSPRREIMAAYFDSRETADRIHQDITAQRLDFNEIYDTPPHAGGPKFKQKFTLRPKTKSKNAPQNVLAAIESLQEGQISAPLAWKGGYFVILKLTAILSPDQPDFETLTDKIKEIEVKEQGNSLSAQLFSVLKEKYPLSTNKEIYDTIDIYKNDYNDSFLQQPICFIGNESIQTGVFLKEIHTEIKSRERFRFQKEEDAQMKARILENLTIQALITKESLARHYEQQPVFKPTFEFYKQNRLIKELEYKYITSNLPEITPEMIENYYNSNDEEFTQSEKFRIAQVKDDPKLIEKIHEEIKKGNDYFEVTRKYYKLGVPPEEIDLTSAGESLREMISQLSPGQTGSYDNPDGTRTLVRVIARIPAVKLPFSQVREAIAEKLDTNRIAEQRDALLERLTAASEIYINQEAWKKLKTAFGEKNVSLTD